MLIYKQHLRHIAKRRREEPCGEIEWMKKVLPVKKDDEDDFSSKAQIMTLMTTDVDRVSDFAWHMFSLIDAPIEIVIGTVFLYKLLGEFSVDMRPEMVLSLPSRRIFLLWSGGDLSIPASQSFRW